MHYEWFVTWIMRVISMLRQADHVLLIRHQDVSSSRGGGRVAVAGTELVPDLHYISVDGGNICTKTAKANDQKTVRPSEWVVTPILLHPASLAMRLNPPPSRRPNNLPTTLHWSFSLPLLPLPFPARWIAL
jgi:hypothetical protein